MKVQIKKLLIAGVLSVFPACFAKAELGKQIEGIIGEASQKKVQYCIQIVKADSGEVVYSHNSNKPFVPASNMKIITTAAALKYVGADYEYETRVGLWGDALLVVGSGDPLLGDKVTDAKYGRTEGWILKDVTAALKQNGITSIKGIIVDSSIFDNERVNPSWPKKELNRWYACEVGGLNYNGNCVDVTAKSVGESVELTIEPVTGYVKIINRCKPTSKRPNTVWCSRPEGGNTITVRGKCYKECQPVRVAIERPAAFFGFLLAEELAKAGIAIDGEFVEKEIDSAREIKVLRRYRTKLSDVLERCNRDSLGLAAEALLKTIAANSKGQKKNGGWAVGREAISRYLAELGIAEKEFYIDDGSGFSRENKLSANAITKVLLDVYKSENWKLYRDSLAVGGVDGTVGKYFKENKYKGKIFGKTGYINSVRSFSGVCGAREGDYIFSILANNSNIKTRDAINDIAKAILDSE